MIRRIALLGLLSIVPAVHAALPAIDSAVQTLHDRVEAGRQAVGRMQELRRAVLDGRSKAALDELEAMARRGNPSAMVFLGCVYERQLGGVQRDSYRAAQYFHAAASLGDAFALYDLALMYLHGNGIPANRDQAKQLLNMAVKANVKYAAVNLALLAEEKKTWEEAARWYRVVAGDRKHDLATLKYGLYLFRGQGVNKQAREGVAMIRKAADTWNPDALLALAEIYANGLGGQEQNPIEAVKYLELIRIGPREYDLRLYGSIAASLTNVDRAVVARSVEIWTEAHPKPSWDTNYALPIWEE